MVAHCNAQRRQVPSLPVHTLYNTLSAVNHDSAASQLHSRASLLGGLNGLVFFLRPVACLQTGLQALDHWH